MLNILLLGVFDIALMHKTQESKLMERKTWFTTLVLAIFLLMSTSTHAQQEESADAFVAWAREHAIPIATIEPGQGFEDLQPLKDIVGSARVVGLGDGDRIR